MNDAALCQGAGWNYTAEEIWTCLKYAAAKKTPQTRIKSDCEEVSELF